MAGRNQQLTRRWFERHHEDYDVFIVQAQRGLYENAGPALSRHVSGRTLVVGSGPLLNFAAGAAEMPPVCLDLAHAPLVRLGQGPWAEKIMPVCADAAALPFKSTSFDTVVIPFVLHHVAQDSVRATQHTAEKILAEAARVVVAGGRVVVMDLFLEGFFHALQRGFYGPVRGLLNTLGQPMMFFQNSAALSAQGLRLDKKEEVPFPDRIVPTLLIPRWQVNSRWHPARINILIFDKD